jgi:hypothetical protein
MTTSKAKLDFRCPKLWSSMPQVGSGRFCCDCKRVVKDFSVLNLNEISIQIASDADAEMCGSFRAYQLDSPFGNWRDKIISHYQRIALRLKSGSLLKPVTVSLLFLVMLITGCARRLTGAYYDGPSHKTLPTQPKSEKF